MTATGKRQWRSGDWRTRDAIVLSPELWLWYPDSAPEDEPGRLDFELPPGYDARGSGPWDRLGRTQGRVTYALRHRMAGWDARMAIGGFAVESIELPGGRLRYPLLPGQPAPDAAAIRRWIAGGAEALVSAFGRLPVSKNKLMEELECSPATLKRTIQAMRLYLGTPITYDRERDGYHYDRKGEHPYELPGLWFNAEELYALLVSEHMLSHIQPGLLEAHIGPLRHRIRDLLTNERLASGNLGQRVRILQIGARKSVPRHFGTVAGALLQRRRLNLVYHGRERDTITERVASPMRLVHYRDNWYLDAWCHLKKGLRRRTHFSPPQPCMVRIIESRGVFP